MRKIFVTGIGTDVGKTIISAIITEALQADYWKPIQAGFYGGTDAQKVSSLISNKLSNIHSEVYKLQLPASPHISAREENVKIEIEKIKKSIPSSAKDFLVIEGAGGIMVPLNEEKFVLDLIKALDCEVLLVSKNYLGSINHSLLSAEFLKQKNITVVGWIFNEEYMDYENEISNWSGYPSIGHIEKALEINKEWVAGQAEKIRPKLLECLGK